MLNKKREGRRRKDQSGVVSLIVVSILAVVMGLVAVGFSRLMDRELRQSLDQELSAQAYYSAITGLNDARAYLANGGAGFTQCNQWDASGPQYFVSDLSGGGGTAKYSCITIDTNPNELIYALQPDQSITFSANKPNMGRLYFGWENNPRPAAFVPLGASLGQLPQQSGLAASATGLLEVGVYPTPNGFGGSADTNATLSAASRTYYMYPNSGSGAPGSVSYGSNGNFVPGNCKTGNTFKPPGSGAASRFCNVFISNLNGNSNTYYVRLTARYAPIIVTVQASNSGGNSQVSLGNIQAVVDVTGQGTDVLQRIRARIDLGKQYQTAAYSIQSMVAICKGFRAEIDSLGSYGGVSLDPNIPNDSACALPSGGGSVGSSSGDVGPH